MTESIHEFVISELMARRGQWSQIATGSGVPKRSIEKIARREWQNPGVKAIERLAEYLRDERPQV